jgi:hypothetical protein
MRKRVLWLSAMVASLMAISAPAFATGGFDAETEVGDFLTSMISTGWPIFLAIVTGLVAITLASGGIRAVFRKLSKLFTRAG